MWDKMQSHKYNVKLRRKSHVKRRIQIRNNKSMNMSLTSIVSIITVFFICNVKPFDLLTIPSKIVGAHVIRGTEERGLPVFRHTLLSHTTIFQRLHRWSVGFSRVFLLLLLWKFCQAITKTIIMIRRRGMIMIIKRWKKEH